MAGDAPAMRGGEDLLGRDVGVAGDAVLGGGSAALPFMAIGEADGEVHAVTGVMQRAEALAVEPVGSCPQRRIVFVPSGNGAILIDPRGREDRIRELAHRDVL